MYRIPSFITVFFFLSVFCTAQQIQGYVTDPSQNALENIRIEIILKSDPGLRKDTITNAEGFYQLNNIILGVDKPNYFAGDKLSYTTHDNQWIFRLTSNSFQVRKGRLFDLSGRTLSVASFQQWSAHEYLAVFEPPKIQTQLILFSDGVHPAAYILPGFLSGSTEREVDLSEGYNSSKVLKSSHRLQEKSTFRFILDDAPETDLYQPLETEIEIDMETVNEIDFTLQPWPEFFANLYTSIISEQTEEPLENVLAEVWRKETVDTTKVYTNAFGEADFENLPIPEYNNTTPDTVWHYIQLSGQALETKLDSLRITEGTYNKTYKINETEQIKNYKIVLRTADGEGNDLANVNWLVLNADSTLMEQGNSGESSLDSIIFQDYNTSYDVIIKTNTNDDEHEDFRLATTVNAEERTLIVTENELKEYLYELDVIGKDGETGTALDSVDVRAFLNGQLLMNGNSLENTIVNLQTTQPGHTLDLKLLMERNGYEPSDSISSTITEGQANEVVYNFVKETTPTSEAYLWRKFVPEIIQTGTTADVVIKNLEFNYNDTLFAVNGNGWWQDTIPVNSTGTTEYEIKYIPHVQEGNIPLYELIKTLTLSPGQQLIGQDLVNALEQEFYIIGERKTSDGGDAGELNVIFTETDGTIHSTTTNNGEYRLGPFPVGITGDIDFKITGADTTNYFSHTDIPVGGEYYARSGTLPIKDKLTEWSDSTLTYNPNMIQKYWTYPVNDSILRVNKDHLKELEGTSYNAPWAYWNELRVYNTPESDNPDWPEELGQFIRTHTGLPYNIIIVDTPRGTPPQVDLNDPEYMESVREDMGINATSQTGIAGNTTTYGGGSSNNLGFHTTGYIVFTSPEQGQTGTDLQYAIGMREGLGRFGKMSTTGLYKSFMNSSLDLNITINDMIRDFTNVNIIYKNMNSRTKNETHTGFFTLTED